jgi:F420H(2)-dependent quinone reductase
MPPKGHAPFAVFNRTGNVAIRALLESPLHGLASRQLALISVTGRRSGRVFTFPVSYRQDGDTVKIGVEWPDRKVWWRNLLDDGARVKVRIRGQERSGHAVARRGDDGGVTVEVTLD